MKKVESVRKIGFLGDLATGKEEKVLYEIKEKTCRIHALPGLYKLVVLENAEKFVSMIKSPKGEKSLERRIKQLKADAIRHRKLKSEVGYLDYEKAETKEELEDTA